MSQPRFLVQIIRKNVRLYGCLYFFKNQCKRRFLLSGRKVRLYGCLPCFCSTNGSSVCMAVCTLYFSCKRNFRLHCRKSVQTDFRLHNCLYFFLTKGKVQTAVQTDVRLHCFFAVQTELTFVLQKISANS